MSIVSVSAYLLKDGCSDMAKKPVGISANHANNSVVTTVGEPMDIESFVAGCNERGSTAPRYLVTANECKPVPPFTSNGLAHLASLLSDKNTASGGIQRNHLTPEEPKRWAMGFLSRFNPQGHCKVKDAEVFLENFAHQIVAGKSEFEP